MYSGIARKCATSLPDSYVGSPTSQEYSPLYLYDTEQVVTCRLAPVSISSTCRRASFRSQEKQGTMPDSRCFSLPQHVVVTRLLNRPALHRDAPPRALE